MRTDQILNRNETKTERVNDTTRRAVVQIVRALGQGVTTPGERIEMPKDNHSGLFVSFSENAGFTTTETKSVITAAPGTTFTRQIVVSGTLILTGCYLDCFENNAAIVVEDGGRLVLRACHITKKDNVHTAASDTYVQVNTGGYLSVSDCVFHGTQNNTGKLIINDDAANTNRAAVLGSMNLTDIASPYTNVGYTQDVP